VLHPQAVLRIEQLQQLIPLPTATLYKEIEEGRFPKPVRISARTVAWRTSDILQLLESFETVTDIDPNVVKASAAAYAKRAQELV